VGTDDAIKVDTFQLGLKKGGNLLLCTDGLWGEVTDENMHRVFVTEKDVKKICTRLVQMANENGGVDNITALVANVA
jgi:protein phosphatase